METILFIGSHQSFKDLIWKLEPLILRVYHAIGIIHLQGNMAIKTVGVDIDRTRGYKWGTNFIVGYVTDRDLRQLNRVVCHLKCREGKQLDIDKWQEAGLSMTKE